MTNIEERLQLTCLLILSGTATAFALFWLKPIMIPLVLALFLHLAITSLIDFQKKHLKFPHTLAIISTILLGILFVSIMGILISGSISQIVENTDTYKSNIKQLIKKSSSEIPIEKLSPRLKEIASSSFQDAGDQLGGIIGSTMTAVGNIFSKGLLVLIFLLFMFLGSVKGKGLENSVWQESKEKIKRYISAKLLVSFIQAVIISLILVMLNVDLALMFGLFAFILNFIPNIGPIIAALLPLPVVLVSTELSLTQSILAIALPAILMFVIGNLIEPKVVGDSLNLHPITILIALIFWGMLWGIIGMFLAVPLTAVLVLILEEYEITRPIANLFTIEASSKN